MLFTARSGPALSAGPFAFGGKFFPDAKLKHESPPRQETLSSAAEYVFSR